MGSAERTFSKADSNESDADPAVVAARGIDPVGQLIDVLASAYGWSQEYILDQPYTKLKELLAAIRLREHGSYLKQFKVLNLAQGGELAQVQEFFNSLLPKSTTTQPSSSKSERKIVGTPSTPMDLTGIDFIKR